MCECVGGEKVCEGVHVCRARAHVVGGKCVTGRRDVYKYGI